MGRAPAVLSLRRGRLAALAVLLGVLVAYYVVQSSLWHTTTWPDVAWLSLVLMPAVFALVWCVLPLWRARGLLPVALAFGALAFLCSEAGIGVGANFAKLAGVTAIAFWFLGYFESVSWVLLVALVIPWVDAYSVWRGPTHSIVTHRQEIFAALSFAFPVPGEHAAAQLGLPDLLFFGLFLGASVRFALRPRLTWLLLTASFGATMSLTVLLSPRGGGLPALPGLSLGFLIANGDLLWRALRARRATESEPVR